MTNPKKERPKIEPLPIDKIEEINAQDRISRMLKKSGFKSRILERFAGLNAYDQRVVLILENQSLNVFMNKGELVDSIYNNVDGQCNKADINKIVGQVFDTIAEAVANGEKVTIVGFGAFEKRERKERVGHNPKTGEKMAIPSKAVPVFSAGKNFRELVNDNAS